MKRKPCLKTPNERAWILFTEGDIFTIDEVDGDGRKNPKEKSKIEQKRMQFC